MKNPGSALCVKTILFFSRVVKMTGQESPDPCDPTFEPQTNDDSHHKTNGWNRNYSKEQGSYPTCNHRFEFIVWLLS